MAGTGTAHLRSHDESLLRVEDLVVEYRTRNDETVHAVSGVSLDILSGETLGLVGESGCGKSTTGRAVLMLDRPQSGSVEFAGASLVGLKPRALRDVRSRMQMIFQDPISSLNPRRTVRDIVAEGLAIRHRFVSADQVDEVLAAVGLDAAAVSNRRPYEFSGGQCQRIAIARALMLEPQLIICDEPVSALDVSVQAQILNLLKDMKQRYGLTLLFIAHDLAVVKNVSDRIAVMYLGKLCEVGPSASLYDQPAHHYSAALIEAIPEPDPDVELVPMDIADELPSPINPPSGCRFRTRCPAAQQRCTIEEPTMRAIGDGHYVACHFPLHGGAAAESDRTRTGTP